MMRRIDTKELRAVAPSLEVMESILLCGWVYTARDAAHKRFFSLLDAGKPLPVDIDGAVIFYAGPTPTPPGMPIGSCGPTTSGRMDVYVPRLMSLGLTGMIGKGERSPQVIEAIKQYRGVYFCAVGGAGAAAAQCVKSCEVVAFEDLGCESVKRLYLEDFPLTVAVDTAGRDIFSIGKECYRQAAFYATDL